MASLLPKPEAVAAEIERLQARAKRQRERAKTLGAESLLAKKAAEEIDAQIAWLRQAPGGPAAPGAVTVTVVEDA